MGGRADPSRVTIRDISTAADAMMLPPAVDAIAALAPPLILLLVALLKELQVNGDAGVAEITKVYARLHVIEEAHADGPLPESCPRVTREFIEGCKNLHRGPDGRWDWIQFERMVWRLVHMRLLTCHDGPRGIQVLSVEANAISVKDMHFALVTRAGCAIARAELVDGAL